MIHHNLKVSCSLAALASAFLVVPLAAQDRTPATPGSVETPRSTTVPIPAGTAQDDYHTEGDEAEIVVTASGLDRLDILAGTSVVTGLELQRNLDGQLGDILDDLPGVSSTSFSPGASRPVLRGLSGERVRVLIDGIGAIDASNTSADHAVSIDPLTAERIEVLRGPAVLLYGSQAIGGAVNVLDKRIPRRPLEEPIHVDTLASYDTVNDEVSIAGSADVKVGGGFVFHADGSYRDAGDLNIPGYQLSEPLRADILADAAEERAEGNLEEAEELLEAADQRGVLPNSFTTAYAFNGGLAFFDGDSNFGFSAGYYNTDYGVPGRPGTGHHHGEEGEGAEEGGEEEEGPVTIGLEQFRLDYRGDLRLGSGFLGRLKTRVGYSDYTHTEFEGDEVGTVFDVQGIEARAEFVQNPIGGLRGQFGVQYYFRDFQAIGAEAFVAPNETDQIGFFALQEFGAGPFEIEGAIRYENTDVSSAPLGIARNFDAVSGALGASYALAPELRIGINGTRVSRAPAGEELFANGPHIATQAFEIGDPDLDLERAWGVEAYLRGAVGPFTINLAGYRNWFDGFIYLDQTGEEEDDLPVFVYRQNDATYTGFEAQVTTPLYRADGFTILADGRAEYVHAELDDDTPLPRIPPLSLLGALEFQSDPINARAEVQWFDEQDRVAPFELPTDGFAFVNASVAWRPFRDLGNVTLLAQVRNIFDVEGRRAASFTKDFVPLGGRNFRVSLRTSF